MIKYRKCVNHKDTRVKGSYTDAKTKMIYTVGLCVAKWRIVELVIFWVHGLLTAGEMGWAPRSGEQAAAGREMQKSGPCELW